MGVRGGVEKKPKMNYCMADSGNAVTILPGGEIGLCEHFSETEFIGHIDREGFDEAVAKLLKDTFAAHRRIIFDGNGYSEDWEKEAEKRGLLNLKTSVDAYKRFDLEKRIQTLIDPDLHSSRFDQCRSGSKIAGNSHTGKMDRPALVC